MPSQTKVVPKAMWDRLEISGQGYANNNNNDNNYDAYQYFYRTQVYLGSDLWVQVSLTDSLMFLVDLTDVTLVDEDTNSILADDTNRSIPGNLEMQVRQSYLVRKSYFVRKSCLMRKSYLVRKIYLNL